MQVTSFGLATFGIAAVNTALWDCLGKALGVPCWQLWGAVREHIPAYAMAGWLNYDDEQVQRICAQAVEQGVQAVKIKVGYPTLEQDILETGLIRPGSPLKLVDGCVTIPQGAGFGWD